MRTSLREAPSSRLTVHASYIGIMPSVEPLSHILTTYEQSILLPTKVRTGEYASHRGYNPWFSHFLLTRDIPVSEGILLF